MASMNNVTIDLSEDKADEWRLRLVHDNGHIIADSGRGYSSNRRAKSGIRSVNINAPDVAVEERLVRELEDP